MTDDFSNYPKSINEAKAEKAHDASKWTPRDALIDVLRRIDAGEWSPDTVVIVSRTMNKNGATQTEWVASGPNIHTTLGMLSYASHRIAIGGELDDEA